MTSVLKTWKAMKLLLINHFPLEGSGSGVYTRNLAKALVARGHEVQVLVPEYETVDTSSDGFLTHTVLFEETGVEREPSAKPELNFPFPCFTTHPRSHFTFYDMDQGQIEAYRDAFRTRLTEILETFEPEVIHAGHVWVLADLVRETGRPYVVTSHGTDLMGFRRDERFRKSAADAAAGACRIITISRQADADFQAVFGLAAKRRTLIYSGCDTGVFHKKARSKEDLLTGLGFQMPPRHVVCFAGKLVAFKGVDVLLAAAAKYEQSLEDQVATIIAGDGVLKPALMAQAEALGLKGIRFVGHQTQERLAEFYSVGDVFAMPSRSEPFGLAALEAMACGLPVAGTSAGGLDDIITPEVGCLVPVDDPFVLAEKIVEILSLEGPEKKEIQQRCIRYVETRFSWAATAERTEQVYLSCVSNGQPKDNSGQQSEK
jgi:glycosyltransferase involved in cell wall biosynthesis